MFGARTGRAAVAFFSLFFASAASRGAVVGVSSLPDAAMTRIPARPPSHVSGGERVSGLFVAQAPTERGAPNYKRIEILASARDAATFARQGYVQQTEPPGSHECVYLADDSSVSGDPWPVLARGDITTYPGGGQSPVLGVHVESLDSESPEGKTSSLKIVDAWLDTRTRGLKLITRTVVPLESVAEGPFGIRVFAARTSDAVHFVVLPPVPEEGSVKFGGQFDRGIIEASGEVGVSQCRHSRVTLETPPGTGEHAVVSFQHVERAPKEAADARGDDKNPSAAGADSFATTRTRLVQVHLSASRTASAPEPLVSVSFRVDKPKPFGT